MIITICGVPWSSMDMPMLHTPATRTSAAGSRPRVIRLLTPRLVMTVEITPTRSTETTAPI